jgi:CRISPR-associated endonuclease Cas1
LQDPSSTLAYCSDECLKRSKDRKPTKEQNSPPAPERIKRRAEIRVSEDEWLTEGDDSSDDALWHKRARHWKKEVGLQFARRPLERHASLTQKPLILNGHGVKLRVERGSLLVQNGFTHYPQAREEWRFFPADPDLPSRIVLLDTSGYLTIDVLNWLSSQNIPLIVLNWKGEVSTLTGFRAPDPALQHAQLLAEINGTGLRLSVELIKAKITGSQATLNRLPITRAVDEALATLDFNLGELTGDVPDVETLRMIEARAANAYFKAWRDLELNWKGTNRHPIPPQWRAIGRRESLVSQGNRHATHPVNAMLNYAYRMLESQVRISTVALGLDPTIGFLHANREGRVALVYDLMEPLRPKVDRVVLSLATSTTFTPRDFLLTQNGKCRLHPEFARRVVNLALRDNIIQDTVSKVTFFLLNPRRQRSKSPGHGNPLATRSHIRIDGVG